MPVGETETRPEDVPAWLQSDAARRLMQTVAVRVWRRHRTPAVDVEDFEGELWAKLLEKSSQYNAQCGSIEGWLFGIAKNLAIDTGRKQRLRRHQAMTADPADLDPRMIIGPRLAEEWPAFSEAELESLERTGPMARVVGLLVTGAWELVPKERWGQWLVAANLSADFPGHAFFQGDAQARYTMLAEHAHASRNLLAQWVRRCRGQLRQLPTIVAMARSHRGG